MLNESLFRDFCLFSKQQIASWDIDPVYPVLGAVYRTQGIHAQRDTALWRTFLYVTFYDLGSAEKVWALYPQPQRVEANAGFRLKTGVERRGFRGNGLAALHVNAFLELCDQAGGVAAFVEAGALRGGTAGWDEARRAIRQVPYAGNWASYKWADLLKNVHGYPIEASDIGVGGGRETAGPIPGMAALTGLPWQVCATDVLSQKHLLKCSVDAGVPFAGLDQMETCLCDFYSLCKGRYYTGNDIDQMQEKLQPDSLFWGARRAALPHAYLGEVNGWAGVRKQRLGEYQRAGIL